MQERVVEERDAERVGPSWYLSRDGEQIGPLTDREVSLFAEGGNFRPGDLLWTAGLGGWKPAENVFCLKTQEAAHAEELEDAVAADDVFEAAVPESEDESASIQLSGDTDAVFEFVPSSGEALAAAAEPDVIEPTGEDVTVLVQELKGETEPPNSP